MKSSVPVVHLGYQEVRLSCTDFPEISDYVDREKENSSERKRYPPFTLNGMNTYHLNPPLVEPITSLKFEE